MTINYNWYIPLIIGTRQCMQHLSSRQLFITVPSPSFGLKKSFDFIFKVSGTISYFSGRQDNISKSGTVPANQGRMACMPPYLSSQTIHWDRVFCGICGRQCHYEFNTVFWKSCIVFCGKFLKYEYVFR